MWYMHVRTYGIGMVAAWMGHGGSMSSGHEEKRWSTCGEREV
jgi:hypothetical protein